MFDSVQKKLLTAVGGTTILIFGGMTVFLTTEATDELSREASEKLRLQTERLATAIDGEMRENQKVAETLVAMIEQYDRDGARRAEASQMLKTVAEKNPNVLGTYLAYEPNAFDGQDHLHEIDSGSRSNDEGRFAPYWNRFGEALGLSPLEDLENQDWYVQPIQLGEPLIKGPFVYEGHMMLSYLHPIERNGEPIGVGGVDVSVGYWKERAGNVTVQESGYAFIVASDGTFLAHPNEDWVGNETLRSVGDSLSISAFREMAQHLEKGRGGNFEFSDPVTGEEVAAQFRPIETGGFAVGAVAPRGEILAGARYLRNTFLGIGLASLLLLLGIVFYLLRWSVVSPLRTVTAKVQAVAGGNTDVHVESRWNDEIGQLADAFNEMVEQIRRSRSRLEEKKKEAERANRAKSTFLANMSHEIRTPLTSVIGFAEAIGEEAREEDGPTARFATLIEKSGRHLLETLDGILNLSKLEAGKMELAAEPVDLAGKTKAVVEELRPKARDKELTLHLQTGQPVWAEADAGGVQIVVRNLLINAIKYTKAGTVYVRVYSSGAAAVLEVEDTGIGMESEVAEGLFEPFRQASEGKARAYEGTGLGLAVTRKATEEMDGSIEVETEKGEGSRFTVRLPTPESKNEEAKVH